jgi:hypothetical protein
MASKPKFEVGATVYYYFCNLAFPDDATAPMVGCTYVEEGTIEDRKKVAGGYRYYVRTNQYAIYGLIPWEEAKIRATKEDAFDAGWDEIMRLRTEHHNKFVKQYEEDMKRYRKHKERHERGFHLYSCQDPRTEEWVNLDGTTASKDSDPR